LVNGMMCSSLNLRSEGGKASLNLFDQSLLRRTPAQSLVMLVVRLPVLYNPTRFG
jgi:hypothetical protein